MKTQKDKPQNMTKLEEEIKIIILDMAVSTYKTIRTVPNISLLDSIFERLISKSADLRVREILSLFKREMEKVLDEEKSVEELLTTMGEAYKDSSVQVAFKEGYNTRGREQRKRLEEVIGK